MRLGGYTDGVDTRLSFGQDGAEGRYGSFTAGQDVKLRHYGGEVRGRFGGVSEGMDFRLDLGNVPLPLGALLAVCAFRVWQLRTG